MQSLLLIVLRLISLTNTTEERATNNSHPLNSNDTAYGVILAALATFAEIATIA